MDEGKIADRFGGENRGNTYFLIASVITYSHCLRGLTVFMTLIRRKTLSPNPVYMASKCYHMM